MTRDRTPSAGDEGAGYWWPLWMGLLWGLAVLLHHLYATRRLSPPPRPLPAPPAAVEARGARTGGRAALTTWRELRS